MYNYSKYSSDKLSGEYDVALIGSGLGALTAAALLTKAGKRVIILERHFKPGGFTHTFKRGKYEWDVGVHYVGQVNKESTMMRKLFDIVTDSKLRWADIGKVYDRAVFGEQQFDFVSGEENQKTALLKYFPSEKKAIHSYFNLLKKMGSSSGWFFGERTMPFLLSKSLGYFLRRKHEKYIDSTTYEALNKLTENNKLISLLCARCGNYGLLPHKSSILMHTAIANHYMDGAAYPVGGADEIYRSISDVITKNKSEIYVRAEVKEILSDSKKVTGLLMEDGSIVKAKKYISNVGLQNTFSSLLGNNESFEKQRVLVKQISASTSHFCLYAGFNGSDKELNLPKHNLWIYNSFDMKKDFEDYEKNPSEDFPLVYISFPSAKDETWEKENPSMSTVQILVPSNYAWFEKWNDSHWKDRSQAYEDFKSEIQDRLLKVFFKHFPNTKPFLEIAELSSPLSTKHFTNYSKGEIYGLSHSPLRFQQKWIRPYTSLKNLFLTGQDILTVGVGGALFSGAFAAFAILKWRLFKVFFFNRR